ncbi:unnamed protein product [Strongylus vulgaris]|uniref:NTR domain-containing protein n=1 Tax=Strongylus vulgaris TaxID=40348 RepID=A0A3P7KCJ1_STRVU|nr:unnamed protein product [Strongylus vulgaris]
MWDLHISTIPVVAHVKIFGLANNGRRNEYNDVAYVLEYKEVFKYPPRVNQLPKKMNTAATEASCGIRLKIGAEYLLAGSMWPNGYFFMYRCGQIVDDGAFSVPKEFGMPMEWHQASTVTKEQLHTINCDRHRVELRQSAKP